MHPTRLTAPLFLLFMTACANKSVQSATQTTQAGMGGAVSAPFRDFNLVQSKIPPVLRAASDDPYARPSAGGCETIGVELARLNDALGPDIDVQKPHQSEMDRGANFAANSAVNAVKDLAEGWIPMRSWVRYMTGAERHSKEVRTALEAGQIRRAYLKGLAQSQGCKSLGPVAGPFIFPAPPRTPSSVE